MIIHGFQKMTMLDFPGKIACTVFTNGCNFRCPFCHNARLVTHPEESDVIDEREIFDYLEKRKKLLDGICLTGGEPLIQSGVEDFLRRVKKTGLAVKLDTNGSFPKRLKSLVREGLVDCVAMDIKNSRESYAKTVGVPDFDITPVCESVKFLLEGTVDYEFRTTVVNELHSAQDMENIGEWIRGAKRYYLQNFVDSGDLICSGMSAAPLSFMQEAQQKLQSFVEKVEIRGI